MNNPTQSNTIQQLNTKQQKAIDLLLKDKTDAEVAIAVGVGRDTVNRWRNHNPEFVVALNEQRNQLENEPEFRVSRLFTWALEVIETALTQSDIAAAIAVVQALKESNNTSSACVPQLTVICQSQKRKTQALVEHLESDDTPS